MISSNGGGRLLAHLFKDGGGHTKGLVSIPKSNDRILLFIDGFCQRFQLFLYCIGFQNFRLLKQDLFLLAVLESKRRA